MKTWLLDVVTWDLCLDAAGNWAIAEAPYSLAQDVASAARTFLGEPWYDSTLGVDYFGQVLGKTPPLSLLKELLVQAALGAVPKTADVYVKSAVCVIQSFDPLTRTVVGQIQFIDSNGKPGAVAL